MELVAILIFRTRNGLTVVLVWKIPRPSRQVLPLRLGPFYIQYPSHAII